MNLLNYVRDKMAGEEGRIAELTRAIEQHRKEYVLYSAVVGEMGSAGVPDAVVAGYRDKANAAMTGIGDAAMEIDRLKVRLEVLKELEPVVARCNPRDRKQRPGSIADRLVKVLVEMGAPMKLGALVAAVGLDENDKKAVATVRNVIARYLRSHFVRVGPGTYGIVKDGEE